MFYGLSCFVCFCYILVVLLLVVDFLVKVEFMVKLTAFIYRANRVCTCPHDCSGSDVGC